MKTITDPLRTRQIQPIDFSFLSLADKDIVLAVEAMLRTMYNFPDDIPIILQGLEYSQDSSSISDGKVLFSGIVYDVEHLTLSSNASLIHVSLYLRHRVVSPSPVLDKNLSATINCHYEYYGTLTQASISTPAESLSHDRQYSFVTLLRVESISSLASQATSIQIQQLSDSLTTTNTTLSSLRQQLLLERSSRQSDIDGIKFILNTICHQFSGSVLAQLAYLWCDLFGTDDWNNHIYNNNANTDNQ